MIIIAADWHRNFRSKNIYQVPAYLTNNFVPVSNVASCHHLRSAAHHQLTIPCFCCSSIQYYLLPTVLWGAAVRLAPLPESSAAVAICRHGLMPNVGLRADSVVGTDSFVGSNAVTNLCNCCSIMYPSKL